MTSLLNRSLGEVQKSRENASNHIKPLFGNSRTNQPSDSWKHDLFDSRSGNGVEEQSINTVDARSPALLITNLHYDVSEAELEALFAQIGKIDRGPLIKFDQSGRATEGLAFISYENEAHAAEAVKAFNGARAKGQPIGLQYEYGMPMWVRRGLGLPSRPSGGLSTTAGTPGLLGRIQHDRSTRRPTSSPYESDRYRSSRSSFPPRHAPRGPARRDSRPSRGSFSASSSTVAYRPREPRGFGQGGPRSGLKSAQDLDKELEAFMVTTPQASKVGNGVTVPKDSTADVQMGE